MAVPSRASGGSASHSRAAVSASASAGSSLTSPPRLAMARSGSPGDHVRNRRLEIGRALPEDVVHPRGLHSGPLQQPERLSRLDGFELHGVADKDEAPELERVGDPHERLHLHRADHGGLVDDHDGARKLIPRPPKLGLRCRSFRYRCRSGPAAIAGWWSRSRSRSSSTRAAAKDGTSPNTGLVACQPDDLVQHPGLAGTGEALHADDGIPRKA